MSSFTATQFTTLRTVVCVLVLVCATSSPLVAQTVHYLQRGDAPPGMIGQQQLLANEALRGYVQPVKVVAPTGALIQFWDGNSFQPAGESSATLSMSVGGVYRIKITRIPRHEGVEIFPTVELTSRLYPPAERVNDFPVIVEIPTDDLDQAIDGTLVTRVVYLENPETAMPYRQTAFEQPYFDVRPQDDPLQAAYRLGRAFAVVRLGSRIPDLTELQNGLGTGLQSCTGCPPDFETNQNSFRGADEYIYDGGDRNGKTIVAADWSLRGLDTQDTIAHFDTLDGGRVVAESNRVQIYAPRFAAVRQVSGAIAANAIDAAVLARKGLPNFEHSQDQRSTTTMQNIQPRRNVATQVVTSFRDQTRGLIADDVWQATGFSNAFMPYEDFQIIRNGFLENAEKARLGIRIDAAETWNSNLQVQIANGKVKPLVVRDALAAAETLVDGKSVRPAIRLVKVASINYARPGEEVDFTIRFDNIGNEAIGNVTLVDNLTGRLEYIADSSQCSKKSELKIEKNSSDSQILRWEITDPLEPSDGGIIRFKCRVR